MNRKSIVTSLIAIGVIGGLVGLTVCNRDRTITESTTSTRTTTTSPTDVTAFGEDDFGASIVRGFADTIVATVEVRGGTPEQAVAALVASNAETGWRSALPFSPQGGIRDIFGWRYVLPASAESWEAAAEATQVFMDVAATVRVDPADPAAYALAVQRADPRGYITEERLLKSGRTPEQHYSAALPRAQSAYEKLRPPS